MTGGDLLKPRSLGTKDICEFKAGKVLIQTNNLPFFSKKTVALKQRIEIIKLPYTFTDDEELLKDTKLYKPINKNLKNMFSSDRYKRAFINILFYYYKIYIKEGLKDKPQSVIDETNKYFKTNQIKKFFYDNYVLATEEENKEYPNYTKIFVKDIRDLYETTFELQSGSISCNSFVEELDDLSSYITRPQRNFLISNWILIDHRKLLEKNDNI